MTSLSTGSLQISIFTLAKSTMLLLVVTVYRLNV